ncbi:MAG TPA: ATPase, T2SS/T4P/T4SS family, partial [Bordetella sp.]|nr:ATPase, T2SS/T4P/T4SS family [Bordetella sp.]
AKHHARLQGQGRMLELEDLGSLGGTLVNGTRITVHRPVLPADEILIGPCRIRVRQVGEDAGPTPMQVADGTATLACAGPAVSRVPVEAALAALALLPHRRRLHAALLQALDLRRRDVAGMSDTLLRNQAQHLLDGIAAADTEIPAQVDRAALCRDVLDEAVGLGPLEPLLADAGISEIMINRHDEIYIERGGRLWRHDAAFSSEQSVRWVIERIVAPVGRRIDESAPMVDARLPDGSRVNAVIPPVALKGASLTIRKFPAQRPCMADLVRTASIDSAMAEFLALCVRSRKNIVVSGGTGSGKTTLLNILSNAIPEHERILTIEDAAELRLDHAHLVSLEARPPNLENRGRIDIRDLVRNALRMRPDRIVVGECRGAEAFDMLTAMNTGHEGSLTTLHANSPRDALGRLEAMVLMAGMDLPLAVVREHIGASIDIIVQQTRLSDGRRVAASIVEITGLESGRIQLQELFRYQNGQGFVGCGLLPSFADDWRAAGIALDTGMFCRGMGGAAMGPAS